MNNARCPPAAERGRIWEPLKASRAIAGEIKANMQDDVTSDHGWLYVRDRFARVTYSIAKG